MEQEHFNNKKTITERFINSLDYLIDSGRLKNVAEFERITGVRSQRITGMRKSISEGAEDSKSYYANTDHLAIINEKFGVSLNYLINGEKPILSENANKITPQTNVLDKREFEIFKEQFQVLKEKVSLLSEMMEFYKEKMKG